MTNPPRQQQQRHDQVGKDLTGVAKLSTGIFVVAAVIGGILALSQDQLLVEVGNQPWLFFWVAVFTVLAIALNLTSFLFEADVAQSRKNKRQEGFLVAGAVFFLAAVALTIAGIACATVGEGRPSITDVSVKPNSMVEVSFTVHANGVKRESAIIVEVHAFNGIKPVGNGAHLYRSLLRPDATGEVRQKVSFVYKRIGENRLTIRTRPDHEGIDGADCDVSQTTGNLGCTTVMLP